MRKRPATVLPLLPACPSIARVSKPAGQAPEPRLTVVSAGTTDVGRKRTHNEDCFLVDDDLQLYVVADGMGGHAGGGTASRLAVETIDREVRSASKARETTSRLRGPLQESPLPEVLRSAVEKACQAIFSAAQDDPQLQGMGTTVIALLVKDNHALFAHVGDSRAYLVRGDLIQQISEDHSLVNEQIKAGMITPEEAKHSRYKNIITRSVGFEEEVQVDVMGLITEPNDVFILCSDGLANMVDDNEMREIARRYPIQELPRRFVDLANERGGDDNVTVIVVQVLG